MVVLGRILRLGIWGGIVRGFLIEDLGVVWLEVLVGRVCGVQR